jgi:hypothetical protein
VLQPDVAAAFPTSVEVNEALRALAGIIQKEPSYERRIPPTPFNAIPAAGSVLESP